MLTDVGRLLTSYIDALTPAQGGHSTLLTVPSTSFQTSNPIPTPARTPPPDVNGISAVYSQRAPSTEPEASPLDFKPIVQPIIDVDLESIEEKRWRRPGVHLPDYFNYGFDEKSWRDWCERQRYSREERERERDNPFQVFAQRPLSEAWGSLPMELKGMMMQTIMSSFNQQGAGPANMGGMQGMMPGMHGMQGMGMNVGMGMANPMMNNMGNFSNNSGGPQIANGPGGRGGGGGGYPGMNFGGGNGGMNMGNMGGNMNALMNQMQGNGGNAIPNSGMMPQQQQHVQQGQRGR